MLPGRRSPRSSACSSPAGGFSLEHVRSPDSQPLARWQDRLERPWGWVAGGCHPNRDTARALETAGFDTASLGRDRMPKTAPIVRPLVRGAVLRLASD